MILIDRKKVKEAKNDIYYMGHVSSSATEQIYLCNCASFDSGVAFAEKELQTLAIEFMDWSKTYYYKFDSTEKNFEKFLSQRKAKTENQYCITCDYHNKNVAKCKSCASSGNKRTNHSDNDK